MDAPDHTRLRALCATAFTPARVAALKEHIQEIADQLIDQVLDSGQDGRDCRFCQSPCQLLLPLRLFGVPVEDHQNLKDWSTDFAEMLGNFQHNPDRARRALRATENMVAYFQKAMREQEKNPRPGLSAVL